MRALFLILLAIATPCFVSAQEGTAKQAPGVGDEAPDFSLVSTSGELITLSKFKEKNPVVLYFYPRDNTPGCTKEAQDFRDDYERFKKAGAVILGVSVDDQKSHQAFTNKQKLNFPLLSDVGGKVARQYGVMGWIMAKRATYLVGRDGKIKQIFLDVDVEKHSKEVLRAVLALAEPGTIGSAR